MLDWLLTLYTLSSKLTALARRLVLLEAAVPDTRKEVKELSATLNALQTKVARLDAILVEMKTAQVNISADIADIKAKLPAEGGLTAAEVASLSASLDGLETKAAAVAAALSSLDAENTTATA